MQAQLTSLFTCALGKRTATMMLLILILGIPVPAQNATGAVNGTIKDPSEAVIGNANVTATNKATNASRKVKSADDGVFAFDNLQPGQYEVKVEAQGFSTQVVTLIVEVGTTLTRNFAMTVGQVTDVVDVTGASAPIINKTDSSIG